MDEKKISSEFEKKVVDVLSAVVEGQSMKLYDTESRVWESRCVCAEDLLVTTITQTRDDGKGGHKVETMAKIVFDHDTMEEKRFLL